MRLAKLLIAALLGVEPVLGGCGLGAEARHCTAWFEVQENRGWQAEHAGAGDTRLSVPAPDPDQPPCPGGSALWHCLAGRLAGAVDSPGSLARASGPALSRRRRSGFPTIDQTAVITADGVAGQPAPETRCVALELEQMAAVADSWQIARGGETVLSGAALDLRMAVQSNRSLRHTGSLQTPGNSRRAPPGGGCWRPVRRCRSGSTRWRCR